MKSNLNLNDSDVTDVSVVHARTLEKMKFCLGDRVVIGGNTLEIRVDDMIELDALIVMLTRFREEFEKRHGFSEV